MAKRPFTQEWPWLAWPSLFGTMRTSFSPCVSARNEQPTPQYAHVEMVLFVAWPSSTSDFSLSAPVGHACIHAPHDTQSESRNDSFWLADTIESNPRP